MLCDLLAATGVAGAPDSFFMQDIDPVWARQWGLPEYRAPDDAAANAAYLRAAIRAGSAGTGRFGLRLMQSDLGRLCDRIDTVYPGLPTDAARLQRAFGDTLYIRLARADRLAQAVSMVMAEQTGLWHIAPDGTELERLSPPQTPEYDFDRIAAKLAQLEQADADWLDWFEAQGIEPLQIAYEDLAARPGEQIGRICSALGVSVPSDVSLQPTVAKMPAAQNQIWIARFREDAGLT